MVFRGDYHYARDVLGWSGYAPWLYVYSAIAGIFKEGWIPDNYYGEIIVPKIKGEYGRISSLNCLSEKLIDSVVFPDLLHVVNGTFVRSTDRSVMSPKSIQSYLFGGRKKVVFKADSSNQGKGLTFLDEVNFSPEHVRRLGNGVIQSLVQQHQFFRDFVGRSTATLRLTTVLDSSGNVTLRACYLRFGQGDDTHVMSASHIRVAVDIATGVLADIGYSPNWNTLDCHPDSGTTFAEQKVPGYERCVDMVTRAHRSFPYVRSIGWDIVVDENENPNVIEWNGFHNDIKFSEATQGPCFTGLDWDFLHEQSNLV